ncbi:hypothetical protein LT493_34355 [Streptomyces tricolor]|nr:hypothetical protein [Streptomyces tricolor]
MDASVQQEQWAKRPEPSRRRPADGGRRRRGNRRSVGPLERVEPGDRLDTRPGPLPRLGTGRRAGWRPGGDRLAARLATAAGGREKVADHCAAQRPAHRAKRRVSRAIPASLVSPATWWRRQGRGQGRDQGRQPWKPAGGEWR